MIDRISLLAVLLGAEVLAGSLAFDGAQLAERAEGLQALLKNWGAWGLRWGVAGLLFFGGFAFLQGHRIPAASLGGIIRPGWLVSHVAALTAFAALSRSIYGGGDASNTVVIVWAALGLITCASAALTFVPLAAWISLRRETGSLWLIAFWAAALACLLGAASRYFWQPVTALTFALVHFLLRMIITNPVVEPERFLIGTSKFRVIISPECSGLEGMGLMLIFGLLWLYLFRHELRFPRALVLLPAGIVILYFLNVFRIFALVLIGNAGWREIAARGFHSQAGWIAFCLVALGLLMASRRLQWVSAMPLAESTKIEYPAAPYLVPFMAIMAAGMLSQAMTANFEWFYALRLLGAGITLWIFRRRYADIDWRFGWLGAGAGLLVFALWVGFDRLVHGSAASGSMPSELESASLEVRLAWLVTRISSAVLAVPVAEELTFRGFILRKLMNADFETVSWRSWNWMAVGGSSILFGILHGGHWLAGIAAGAIFSGVMVRRGRLGDSIAAHAVANALLATYILLAGRWDLW